jgi:iron complex transport system permease protein
VKLLETTTIHPRATAGPLPRPGLIGPLLLAAGLLILVALISASTGKVPIALDVQARIIAGHLWPGAVVPTWAESDAAILLDIRLPRVVLAALTGAALAIAGAGYQGLFRNPLAEPYLIGVAPGASLLAIVAIVLPLPNLLYGLGIVQVAAFAGAVLTVAAVLLLARVGPATPMTTLLLAGIALGSLANAGVAALMYLHGDKLTTIYAWLLGGFAVATWRQVALVAPCVVLSLLLLAACGRHLNALQLGEEQAASVGIPITRVRLLIVAAATLATAAAVSASGLIGFVGLIVPHAVRLLLGPDHRRLIPVAALGGAAFLVLADTLARSLPGVSELPVGILTAVCGAPFFLVLLRRQKRAIF